jgi:hypothetical protein
MYGGGGMAMRTTAKYAFRVQIIIANGFGTVLSDSGLNPGTFSCDFWGCSNYYDNTLFYGTCGACEARANTSYQTTATVYTGYNYSGSDTDTMSYSGWDQDTTVVATTPP